SFVRRTMRFDRRIWSSPKALRTTRPRSPLSWVDGNSSSRDEVRHSVTRHGSSKAPASASGRRSRDERPGHGSTAQPSMNLRPGPKTLDVNILRAAYKKGTICGVYTLDKRTAAKHIGPPSESRAIAPKPPSFLVGRVRFHSSGRPRIFQHSFDDHLRGVDAICAPTR